MGRTETVDSQHTATLLPRAPVPAIERPATGLLATLAGVSFVAHMLVAGNYGYFREELYYIADGRHLQAGYVDQPLLMGWLAALMRVLAGDGLVAIHGWTFVFIYLVLTLLRTKPYFLAPAYPILFASGAVAFERWALRPRLAWIRPAYVALVAFVGILLAPDVMPILPPDTVVRSYGHLEQVLADRLGWDSLTHTVEEVYAALPPEERAQACVLTSNYGEAGALQQLAAPGRLPPIISGHNNYDLWGPGTCTGQVLILVGYSPADSQRSPAIYVHITLAATESCQYCVAFERNVPIVVVSSPAVSVFPRLWPSVKHFD